MAPAARPVVTDSGDLIVQTTHSHDLSAVVLLIAILVVLLVVSLALGHPAA